MSIIPNSDEINNAVLQCSDKFSMRFQLYKILKSCNGYKSKGIHASKVLSFLIGLCFSGRNLYQLLESEPEKVPFGKDVVYDFLKSAAINWEKLLFRIFLSVFLVVRPLTSDDRKCALVFDDSPYSRNRSKKVELLSICKDHTGNKPKNYKGFYMLTMGWTDGCTFLPVSFQLQASSDPKLRKMESQVPDDGRTLASKRRRNALKSKPELVLSMLEEIKGTPAQAKYVLFDSWFSSPSALLDIEGLGYHVVSRLKNNNTQYICQGQKMTLSKIYRNNRKRRGRSKYLLSVKIEIRHDDYGHTIPAKLVFVRDRSNTKKWIALISTDVSLTEEEIIELYGKRWDIETFFKMCKSFLRLSKEFQGRTYDGMVAHTTIVCIRYIILALENRESRDEKSICELFFVMCKELDDISFQFAFELIQNCVIKSAQETLELDDAQLEVFLTHFLACLPAYIQVKLRIGNSES